ncbi:MAG: hypothetical protein II072_08925 [Clostridia bacterium]|nr:hypothetical protein [Clostridia bacterium]MBQ5488701.1 hypothetical protein [Clostridia bacterium]
MFQESVDRSHGSSKSDLVLFIVLIAAFFTVGAIVFILENNFGSKLPRYIFIGAVLACLYLVYRLRIVGYRYTIFHEEPKPVYDPRFDDMILHEDYPYPVGTVVFERIVSAKGTILFTVDRSEIEALAKPGEDCGLKAETEFNAACRKPEKAYSLFFRKDGQLVCVYFDPSEEFLGYLQKILSAPASIEE